MTQLFWLLAGAPAQSPAFRWVAKAGGTANDYGNGIAVDGAGNSYVAGSFSVSASFAGTNVNGSGSNDICVAKYDSAGNFLLVRAAGGSLNDTANAVAVDGAGNCYVTGSFNAPATFSGTNISGFGGNDIFIAKYNSAGGLVWVKAAGGPSDDRGFGIVADGSGNVFVTGAFNSTAVFDDTHLVSTGVFNIFVAKYDGAGHLLWARQAGGSLDDYGTAVALDNTGNCYVTGHFGSPQAMFDTITLTNRGARDIFVAKYDGSGNLLWVRQAGGADYDVATGIAVDGAGHCFVTGHIRGTATFGTTSLTSAGLEDIFAAKYDSNGGLLWAARAGGAGADYGYGVAVNSVGDCFITGGFSGTVAFGDVIFTGGGIAVLQYDSTGQMTWAKQAARSAGEDYGFAIATDPTGNCYLTGFLDGNPCTFDTLEVDSTAGADIFVARLDAPLRASSASPRLSIRQQGSQVVLSWPTNNAAGFALYYATGPSGPITWNAMPASSLIGEQYVVSDPTSAGTRFYRLKK